MGPSIVTQFVKLRAIAGLSSLIESLQCAARFSDPDRSLNRKRERFKGFEVGPRSNRGRTVMRSEERRVGKEC